MAKTAATRRRSRPGPRRTISLARALLLGSGVTALLGYLAWRAGNTLHGLDAVGLSLSVILLSIEAFIALVLVLAALAEFFPAARRAVPVDLTDEELPTLDIFILVSDPKQAPKATYSLAVAAQLDCPRIVYNVQLVGYGKAAANPAALIALADRSGATWIAAPKETTEGGAMNVALARTGGGLVLFLQAGDAPTPDLLRRVAGAFVDNPRLALCDIPTFSIDGDPLLTDIDVTQRLPNDPGPYFKAMLKAGTGAPSPLGMGLRTIWLRAAISANGGLSRTNERPDAAMRARAAARRWERALADRPMVAAIAPDTVRDNLQARLAQRLGTIDAALSHDPLFGTGLSLRERLAWIPALAAALLPFAWLARIVIPALAVLLSLPLIGGEADATSILLVIIGLLLPLMLSGTLLSGLRTLHMGMWTEMLETALAVPALQRMMRGLDSASAMHAIDRANGLLIVMFALLLAGTTVGIVAVNVKGGAAAAHAGAAALTIFSAFAFACLIGAIAEPRQRRLSPRMNRRMQAGLLLGGETFFGRLADISVHGARFVADERIDMPARGLAGVIMLDGPAGRTELPVQLSRQIDAEGHSVFGLSFTGRTVGEFATVVRLAHRSGDAYLDLCDARAKPLALRWMSPLLALRGLDTMLARLLARRKRPRPVFVKAGHPEKKGT